MKNVYPLYKKETDKERENLLSSNIKITKPNNTI